MRVAGEASRGKAGGKNRQISGFLRGLGRTGTLGVVTAKPRAAPVTIGRYAIHDRLAAGGMASVHVGRLLAEKGFSRTVAIKRLHPQYALDPEFVGMFLDEARLAARIRHPNVVQTIDVVVDDAEVFLVMDYIEGDSLAHLFRATIARSERISPAHAVALIGPVLRGLHAAHEARDDHGDPLGIVHRDVSPQNVHVGTDGVPRILDFGVAKALGQSHTTQDGQIKGKLAYMSPEQIRGVGVDRRTDVFAASVVLWETLTGRRLFKGDGEANVMHLVLTQPIPPPSSVYPDLPPALDAVVMGGLARAVAGRYPTAEDMANALEDAVAPTPTHKLSGWVKSLFADTLAFRAAIVRDMESLSTNTRAQSPQEAGEPIDVEWGATVLTDSSPDQAEAAGDIPRSASRRRPEPPPVDPVLVEGSQQSSIAVEALPPGHPFADRKPPYAWIGGGVGVGLALVCFFMFGRASNSPAVPSDTPGASAPPVAAAPPVETAAAAPPVAATHEPPPAAVEPTTASAAPAASEAAPSAAAATAPPPAVVHPPPVSPVWTPPPRPPVNRPPPTPAPASTKLYGRY